MSKGYIIQFAVLFFLVFGTTGPFSKSNICFLFNGSVKQAFLHCPGVVTTSSRSGSVDDLLMAGRLFSSPEDYMVK